jgi:Uma2 family endonuclease
MNAFAKVDVETFLKFAAEHPEQRFELERGRIVQQMTGGTKKHGLVTLRLRDLLVPQIDQSCWTLLLERGVKIGTSARYPDIVIEPHDEPDDSLVTTRPVFIVEVLAPTTTTTDLHTKPAEYMAIPTLDAYVVASQLEPAMLVWSRGRDGKFPDEPTEVDGLDQKIEIHGRSISLQIAFADVYAGVA